MNMTSPQAEDQSLQTTRHSYCPLDCPDTCSLTVTVAPAPISIASTSTRALPNRVVAVDGDHRKALTRGVICSKVRDFAQHMYGEERLLYPAIRVGSKGEGRFERISWTNALERLAAQIRTTRASYGGEAILPVYYGGSNGILSNQLIDARFFRRIGASRLDPTVCAMPTTLARVHLYGRMPGAALEDYEHASLIVLWGVNPSATGIHLVPPIQKALKRGAKLVVIDPRRIPLAGKADLHLAPRPGTDVVLALAVIRSLFESGGADLNFLRTHTTGWQALQERSQPWTFDKAAEVAEVPVHDLEHFAELYRNSQPAIIRCGWGLERNRNGGSAAASIQALPAVAGKFGIRGGGFTMSNSRAISIQTDQAINEPEAKTRLINLSQLGRALTQPLDPPIKFLFIYNANPLQTLPAQHLVRRGLASEDRFTVVFDQVMTDTARFADMLLPATTFLEHTELRQGYGTFGLHLAPGVVPPVGEARSNLNVFAELCRVLQLEKDDDSVNELDTLNAVLMGSRISESAKNTLHTHGHLEPEFGSHPVQFVDVFPRTPDQKIHLFPTALDQESPSGLYTYQPDPAPTHYPLALISPATHHTVSSTFGQLLRHQVPVLIHPKDAAVRGISEGAKVRIFNDQGEVHCLANVSNVTRAGVLSLPKGLWSHHTLNGSSANTLCPDSLTDIGGGACYNDARVELSLLR